MTTPKRPSKREPERIDFAREQRQRANEFSNAVWQMVRGRRILGAKFRCEHPLGHHTLDFVCLDLKLNVEVDGKDHFTEGGTEHDARRDRYLRSLGFTVLRIQGFRVTQDAASVRNEIEAAIRERRQVLKSVSPLTVENASPSPPTPLPAAGRGEHETEGTDRGG